MEAKAIARGLRVSPIRARLVADMIRGKSVSEALNILANTNSKSSRLTTKVLKSAIANAVNNNGADQATLYVKEARVDAGPVMKRHFFDSRSHIGHRDHRTSHIIIVVATKN
ncbi:MAG: 50S ribosomal protein L22 [Firmicutes bacterium]|nr:50S ribosomal protein L22 [Bacillota bacterium]